MPVTINGDGSITGLSVGGLGSGVVNDTTLASNAVTTAKIASGAITRSTLPSGTVLQFVSSKKTNVQNTSSTSFVDVSQMSCTITPTASNSKMLVHVSLGMNKNNYTILYQVLRDSTLVGQPDAGSGYGSFNVYTANNGGHWRADWRYDDSPGDTNAHTYKLQVKSDGGSDPEIWINGHHNNSSSYTATSYMSVMEIAG